MMLLTLIVLTTACYLCYSAWVMGGVPESLSSTYYGLKEDGWLFQALCIGIAFGILPMWLDACNGEYELLPFLACGGLMFTGAAPAFKLKLEGAVHYSAAVVCCISSILWLLLSGNYPFALSMGFLGWLLFLKYGKWCWWLEVSVILSVLFALL